MIFLLKFVCVNMVAIASGLPTYRDAASENEVHSYDFPFVSRSQWKAREPLEKQRLNTPVPYVVIHHSYTPAACYSGSECRKAMRSMQNFHIDDRGWMDIGYHFAVGSDGAAYEGRGWETLGAHSLHFNTISIGICLIGDWRNEVPPPDQLKTAKALIAAGVELGHIKPEYKLVGHRQVRSTECPGNALYQQIQQWDHYSKHPSSAAELKYIEELPESVKDLLRNNSTAV